MSTYVVRFMKDVLGQYGRQIEVCQGALEILSLIHISEPTRRS